MNNVVVLPTCTQVTRTEPAAVPDFITPASIEEMNDEQLDALIAAIQARRMRPYEIYKRTKEEKHALENSKIKEKITKKCESIIKTINTADKTLEKLEHQIAELRGLRLQAEMSLL